MTSDSRMLQRACAVFAGEGGGGVVNVVQWIKTNGAAG